MTNNNWDKRWMQLTELIASWSKDRSTGVGAVIVDERNTVVALGWNGFPRGINDDVDERHERPAKYSWTSHAEENAICNASSKGGRGTVGCRMYVNWYPCCPCARMIIQSGIVELIGHEPNWNHHKYGEDFRIVREMLDEAEVKVRFM